MSSFIIYTYGSAEVFAVPEDPEEVGDEEGAEHEDGREEGGVGLLLDGVALRDVGVDILDQGSLGEVAQVAPGADDVGQRVLDGGVAVGVQGLERVLAKDLRREGRI